jgi:hypothetical protein
MPNRVPNLRQQTQEPRQFMKFFPITSYDANEGSAAVLSPSRPRIASLIVNMWLLHLMLLAMESATGWFCQSLLLQSLRLRELLPLEDRSPNRGISGSWRLQTGLDL